MGRPGPYKDLERADSMYWCQLIHTYCGLSFRQIEAKLWPVAPGSYAGVLPDGKDFERWYKGQRAMSPDKLQQMIKTARECKLLPPRTSSLSSPREIRIGGDKRSTDQLKSHLEQVRALHKARRLASAALRTYAATLASANNVLAFDTNEFDEESQPYEIYTSGLLSLADRVDNHEFLDIGPWPSAATEPRGAEVVQLKMKPKATDRKTRKAVESKSR